MPDGHYVRCADCKTEHDAHACFRVVPPRGRPEGDGHVYFICVTCWDKMIGMALMQAFR